MYSDMVRGRALALAASGLSDSEVSRELGVSRAAVREWRLRQAAGAPRRRSSDCPVCDDAELDPAAYSALLGFYLGDGCISAAARYFFLRVACDATYPEIIAGIEAAIAAVRPGGRVFQVRAPAVNVVHSNWKHCPCLFPQHGPGRKHERPIILDDWQREIVATHPAEFLRGLFHSDGCRARNWTRRKVAGEWKRYDYPRWQFTNNSADIRELCCWALDLVDVPWRQSNWKNISVATRAGVARLDELIGLKA